MHEKCRENTLSDQFHRLLATSDPMISSSIKGSRKNRSNLTPDILHLLDVEDLMADDALTQPRTRDIESGSSSSSEDEFLDHDIQEINVPKDFYDY